MWSGKLNFLKTLRFLPMLCLLVLYPDKLAKIISLNWPFTVTWPVLLFVLILPWVTMKSDTSPQIYKWLCIHFFYTELLGAMVNTQWKVAIFFSRRHLFLLLLDIYFFQIWVNWYRMTKNWNIILELPMLQRMKATITRDW